MAMNSAIHPGARVVTADGKQLGKVKDIREYEFKVDVRFAPDFWLGMETIDEVSEDEVQLRIEKDEVSSAKVPDGNIDDSNLPSNQTGNY